MKTWKNLLIPAIVLVVLIAGLIIYNVALKNKLNPVETTASESTATQYVANYTSDQISGIHIAKADGTGFAITSAPSAADGSLTWKYVNDKEDDSKYALSQTNIATFVNIMDSFNIVDTITTGKDTFKEYGLDHPSYTIEYTLTSGEKHTIYLGIATYDDASVYCTMDDDGVVYTVNKIKATKCDNTILDFLDMTVMSVKDTDVASVDIKRAEDSLDISVIGQMVLSEDGKSSEFGWQFVRPFSTQASPTFGNFMDSILALSVTSFVDMNTKDYAKYGLDNPAFVFDITLNSGEKRQIILSRDMGGVYYGASTTSPAVFTLASSVITSLQAPLTDLIKPYVDYKFLHQVKHIDATFPEGSFFMDMEVAEGTTPTDPTSKISVNGLSAKVTAGLDLKNRSYFAVLFESISCIKIADFDFAATPVNTKDVTLVITLNDSTQTTIDLAVRDENTYYAFIDGEYHGIIVNKDSLYKDNGKDLLYYGIWPAYTLLVKAIHDSVGNVYIMADS